MSEVEDHRRLGPIQLLVRWHARSVAARPGVLLGFLVLVTVALLIPAGQREVVSGPDAFAPDTETARDRDRVRDEFGASAARNTVLVLIDAGPGGDVITAAGVRGVDDLTTALSNDPVLADLLSTEDPAVFSFAAAYELAGLDPAQADDDEIDAATPVILDDPRGAQLADLYSQDLDAGSGTAEAALALVRLDPGISQDDRLAAAEATVGVVEQNTIPDIEVSVFSQARLLEEVDEGTASEMLVLMALSALLITLLLAFTYRSVIDVVLAVVGLATTVVWMFGISVLLGPDHLGITGHFTLVSNIIPVLLVGLGVDYALQLTWRYREERLTGEDAPEAARISVATVGAALALTTITTMVGFLSNLASPLPPLRDFGVFTSVGVASALVVMGVLVPCSRTLVDRRRSAVPRSARERRRSAVALGRLTRLTTRRPTVTIFVALVLAVLGVIAAADIESRFSQRELLPDGSDSAAVLDDFDRLFGGSLVEQTHVVIDGDVTTTEAARAMLAVEESLPDVPDVRITAGEVRVESPVAVAGEVAEGATGEAVRAAGWSASGPTDDADMATVYAEVRAAEPERMARALPEGASAALLAVPTTAGEERAPALAERLDPLLAPLREAGLEVTVTSEAIVSQETNELLTSSQMRSFVTALLAAALILGIYYRWAERAPFLGPLTLLPTAFVVAWILGAMWLLDFDFNVITVTVAAIAIGIGVDYGIHVSHRFTEEIPTVDGDVDLALARTIAQTGAALAGSAVTTVVGFGVLVFSSLAPIRQFGTIIALTIVFALAGAVVVQPAVLKLWWQAIGSRRSP